MRAVTILCMITGWHGAAPAARVDSSSTRFDARCPVSVGVALGVVAPSPIAPEGLRPAGQERHIGADENEDGVVVVVRPDQYVAAVLPLDATDELTDFFSRWMLPVG
jgi:phenol 2-monooxygenase